MFGTAKSQGKAWGRREQGRKEGGVEGEEERRGRESRDGESVWDILETGNLMPPCTSDLHSKGVGRCRDLDSIRLIFNCTSTRLRGQRP